MPKHQSRSTRSPRQKRPSNAIITVPAAPQRPWQLNEEEITLVKNHIAKGASDSELQFCLTVARRYKLDPFRGQIWFVKRADKSAEGGHRWIPIVGINGLLHIAARDHRDFGSIEEPEYGPMITINWTYYDKKGTIKAPEWARVRAWKKGFEHPITATVYFEEIYPNVGASPMVRQMPRQMLGKCATAGVVRRSWPGTDGLYIREEFQGPQEFTDSGRRIVYPESEAQTVAPLIENAPHGHEPGSEKAKMAEAALKRVEEADKELAEKKNVKKQETPLKFHLEIDRTNPDDPIVRGDAGEILPLLEKFIKATWKNDWWHVRPEDVNTIHAAGKELKFGVTEIVAKSSTPSGKSEGLQPKASTGARGKNPSTVTGKETVPQASGTTIPNNPDAGPQLVAGTIQRVFVTIKGNKSFAIVTLVTEDGKKREAGCWDKDIYGYLDKGKGKMAEVYFQTKGQYTNLVGLKRIGSVEFEHGKVPAISRDREPGKAGNLFQP